MTQSKKKTRYDWWNSIRTRMLLVLLCVNIAIIAILSVGAYSIFQDSFLRELAGSRTDVLRQIGERSRQFKTSLYTLSNLFESNPTFHTYAEDLNADNQEQFFTLMDGITRQLQASFLQPDLDFYVVYISASGIGYCSLPVPEDYDYMDPRQKVWNRQVVAAEGAIVDVGSYQDRALGIASFSAARSILDEQGELVGFLMINADERQLYRMYADVIRADSNIYVTNSAGQIISSNRSELIGFSYFNMKNLEQLFGGQDYVLTRAEGQRVLFTRYYDAGSGFTVLEEAPLDEVLLPLRRTRQVVILLALLTLGAGALLALHFSRRIAAPIQALRDDMRKVETGDLQQTFAIHSYTEINELSRGMADMLQCIRGLITSIHENERQKRRIELNWLQAQINPHFIYNTLFSIKCMVDMHRNEDAAAMLTLFIQNLRGVLSSPQEMTTVAEQMESIRQYLTLQRYRYDNGFDVLIECDDQAAGCLLPKLLVQPLVENALQHGIDPQSHDGMITVIARRQGDAVCIEVEDNGAGMTPERVRQVMETPDAADRPHLGIRNVSDRIRLHYGAAWGLQIQSEPGRGTRITLRIPAGEQPRDPQDPKEEHPC